MNGLSITPRLYRAYHLSPAGRILRAEILEATDDDDALAKLRRRLDDHAVELWDRSRFIGKVEAASKRMPGAAGLDAGGPLKGGSASRMSAELFKPLFADLLEPDDAERT